VRCCTKGAEDAAMMSARIAVEAVTKLTNDCRLGRCGCSWLPSASGVRRLRTVARLSVGHHHACRGLTKVRLLCQFCTWDELYNNPNPHTRRMYRASRV